MSTATKVSAQKREKSGSAHCNRLRLQGIVPANVYGHGQEPVKISVSADTARPLILSGHKVVDLEIDGATEKALVRDVQWDTFSKHLIHIDFLRIDAEQRILVDVPIHLKGTAPGTLTGGILEQPLHSLHCECLAIEVPDEIAVRLATLEVGQSIHVRDLTDLPASLKVKNAADSVIVHCVMPQQEEAAPASAAIEPEVVGKKTDDAAGK
ncbi:50S ribosomal protein L25 [Caulifigura coniformis]|uniref:Large ribosomal subunit protein bL25 n=1 Tax=Caulifigura coniformis TaxID=2527983 RepID=A0A517SBW8_9PLAN|nr:50S ribosomal protein L25 [Caulifigura coniformis]QDT53630.1 50S ribosomal protein L25 [Caulifigura coniformis]